MERAVRFPCRDKTLYGIVHVPEAPSSRGVLIVVGGPQIRAGSHRQYVLIARALSDAGFPVFRFDYRGMGDSEGDVAGFEGVSDDIDAAVGAFLAEVPTVRDIVIFGLCDGSCAAAFHAQRDPRVAGLVLVNLWVTTTEGKAVTQLRHYYPARLRDKAFWLKLATCRFSWRPAAQSLWRTVSVALGRSWRRWPAVIGKGISGVGDEPLPERLRKAIARFEGRLLFIFSENDLTAKEFLDVARASRGWRSIMASPRTERRFLAGANHTFSREIWRNQVIGWIIDWMHAPTPGAAAWRPAQRRHAEKSSNAP